MLITVSGPPGSGTSTAARRLAASQALEHVSGGDIFRTLADERDLSLAELNERAETDGSIDRDLDRRLHEVARERDDIVLESRLAGWLAGDYADLRIWLDAPVDVRAARIADREDKTEERARADTEEREASEAHRYEAYYGIDIADRSIYDLTVNTARWDVDATAALLDRAASSFEPEPVGQFPVPVDYDFGSDGAAGAAGDPESTTDAPGERGAPDSPNAGD